MRNDDNGDKVYFLIQSAKKALNFTSMVFMGKGRGRGGSQFSSKGGGIISATTRKEKRPADEYDDQDRDRSRSPMSKRPVMERLGPQVITFAQTILFSLGAGCFVTESFRA